MSRQSKKGTTKKPSAKAEGKPLKIKPDYSRDFPTVYSNYASIGHTPYEISIDFCTIPPPATGNLKDDTLYTPVTVRILMPPDVAGSLVEALQTRMQKYKKDFQDLAAELSNKQ